MAKDTGRAPFINPVIHKFVENIERAITSSSIILSSNIQKYFGPDGKTVYIKGNLVFINSTILEIAIFASGFRDALAIDKHRFHYMDSAKKMLFRYDNAHHYHEIETHPYHKHTPDKTRPAKMLKLQDIINEISAIIIGK